MVYINFSVFIFAFLFFGTQTVFLTYYRDDYREMPAKNLHNVPERKRSFSRGRIEAMGNSDIKGYLYIKYGTLCDILY